MQQAMETNWSKEASAAKIRTLTAMSLSNFIEIGHEFCEAKLRLAHGEFGDWVKTTGHSHSTANNMMRLYQEYGADQWSLFGGDVSNSQTFGNLGYSKALALLALPAEEREAFVEANNVGEMSARELKQAIRERDEARHNEEMAKKTIAAVTDIAKKDREEAKKALEAAEQRAQHAEADADAARAGLKEANDQTEFFRKVSEEQKAKIKELESRPVDVAVQVDEEAVKRAAEDAKKAADSEWSARVKELEDKLSKAEEKAKKASAKAKTAGEDAVKQSAAELDVAKKAEADAHAEAERLRAELAAVQQKQAQAAISGDADLAAFKLLFEQTQADVNKLHGLLLKVRSREDSDLAGKLTKALLALADAVRGCAA